MLVTTLKYKNEAPLTHSEIEKKVEEWGTKLKQPPTLEQKTYYKEHLLKVNASRDTNKILEATIVILPSPFGFHCTVSAYDGESITTLQGTGGHKVEMLVTQLQVDSKFKVLKFDNNTESSPALKAAINELMGKNLAACVISLLKGQGILQ